MKYLEALLKENSKKLINICQILHIVHLKLSADLLVRSFHKTYKLNTIITHSANNFGPRQHKEKFIPTIINSLKNKKKIPVYGKGLNVRNWL